MEKEGSKTASVDLISVNNTKQLYITDPAYLQQLLKGNRIPIVLPLATEDETQTRQVMYANDVFVALSQSLHNTVSEHPITSSSLVTPIELSRLVFLTQYGGLVDHQPNARRPIPFVNLADDFGSLVKHAHLKRQPLSDLMAIREALKYCPTTASAILCSSQSAYQVLEHIITDKVPMDRVGLRSPTATVLREGMSITMHKHLNDRQLNLEQLQRLLESSFGKPLAPDFWQRFHQQPNLLAAILIAGDYKGAAILTHDVPDETKDPSKNGVVYLDKFAVDPNAQGSGVADLLWRQMRLRYDLVWRSRVENGVNRWYFDRAYGHMRQGRWMMFWTFRIEIEQLQAYLQKMENVPAAFD